MEATGNRIEPGRVIGEAFETYQNQVGPLLGGALIVIGIAGVIEGILAITGSLILVMLGVLIGLAASFLYTGYVVKLVQDVATDGATSPSESSSHTRRRTWALWS